MTIVHVANTDFEFELTQSSNLSIEESWNRHHLCLQLQFLPLLYAAPEDIIAVSSLPNVQFLESLQKQFFQQKLPTLIPLHETTPFYNQTCLSWGPSLQVQNWANIRKMNYHIPTNWTVIQKINSKAFSMKYSPLSESTLLDNASSLDQWLHSFQGPKVLKTCFGLSGMGHLIINEETDHKKILAFCTKEWNAQRTIIGEPWLSRLFDFSTQWYLSSDGTTELIGSTVFETNSSGGYLGTLAGPEELIFHSYLPFLHEHISVARKMLHDLAKLGYFGHIGVDALLYWCDQRKETLLYPIVEINGRQTLSFAALRLQQLKFPKQTVRLSFKSDQTDFNSLLPSFIINQKGKRVIFNRKLIVEVS